MRHFTAAEREETRDRLVRAFAADARVLGVLVVGSGEHGFATCAPTWTSPSSSTAASTWRGLLTSGPSGSSASSPWSTASETTVEPPVSSRGSCSRVSSRSTSDSSRSNRWRTAGCRGRLRSTGRARSSVASAAWSRAASTSSASIAGGRTGSGTGSCGAPLPSRGAGRWSRPCSSTRSGAARLRSPPCGTVCRTRRSTRLPADIRGRIAATLPASLDAREVGRALVATADSFFAEAREVDAELVDLAARLEPVVRAYLLELGLLRADE